MSIFCKQRLFQNCSFEKAASAIGDAELRFQCLGMHRNSLTYYIIYIFNILPRLKKQEKYFCVPVTLAPRKALSSVSRCMPWFRL